MDREQDQRSRRHPESPSPLDIAVVGAGNIGRALGAGWVRSGHRVRFGARDPANPIDVAAAAVTDIASALAHADAVALAVPPARSLN